MIGERSAREAKCYNNHMFFGLLIVIVGVVFLMQNLGWLSASAWQVIWPILIIIFGISIMSGERKGHGWRHRFGDKTSDEANSNK